MPSEPHAGEQFSCSDKEIMFFGVRGVKVSSILWSIDNPSDDPRCYIEPYSVLERIEAHISQLADRGKLEDYGLEVQLTPVLAAALYLEGVLTSKHLRYAVEDENDSSIYVPRVRIGADLLAVRIMRNAHHEVAISDRRGWAA